MKTIVKHHFMLLVFTLVVSACAPATTPALTTVTENTSTPTVMPTSTAIPTATLIPTITPTPIPPNHPGWMPEGAIARFGMGKYNAITVSPDNSIVAVAGTGGVHFINPLTGHTTDFLETGANVEDVIFSSDGNKIYIGIGVDGVLIWARDETIQVN